jgi:trk system potassium uptake protein TrkH
VSANHLADTLLQTEKFLFLEEILNYFRKVFSLWNTQIWLFAFVVVTHIFGGWLLQLTESRNQNLDGFSSFLDFWFNSASIGTFTGLTRGDVGNYSFGGQVVLSALMFTNALKNNLLTLILISLLRQKRGEIKRRYEFSEKMFAIAILDIFFWVFVGMLALLVFGAGSSWEAFFNAQSHLFNDGVTSQTENMIKYATNNGMLIVGGLLVIVGHTNFGVRAWFYQKLAILVKRISRNKVNFETTLAEVVPPTSYVVIMLAFDFFLVQGGYIALSREPDLTNVQAWYYSVVARTAGFAVGDLNNWSSFSIFIYIVLMWTGGASGSFAGGGWKTSTPLYWIAELKKLLFNGVERKLFGIRFWRRSRVEATIRLALVTPAVVVIACWIYLQQNVPFHKVLFEAVSSFATCGNTLFTTMEAHSLTVPSILAFIFLMESGNLGFFTVILSIFPATRENVPKHVEDEQDLE